MRLDTIATNNLFRRWRQSVMLLLGLVVVMGTIVTLYALTTSMNRALADTFDAIGANIMVTPRDRGELAYGGVTLPGISQAALLTTDDIISINTIANRENIAVVAPKLVGTFNWEGEQVLAVGVDFPYELRLKKWWQLNGTAPTRHNDLLVGAALAQRYDWQPGQQLELEGMQFQVAAVLSPQDNENDHVLWLNLLTAQQLWGRGQELSMIEVAAYCTTCPIEKIIAQINQSLPHARVAAVAEAVRARQGTIDRFNLFAVVVGSVVAVAGGLVVLLNMLATVRERTREFGVLRAVGFRRSHIFEIVLTEVLLVALLGGLAGYLVGVAAARALGPVITPMQLAIPWNMMIMGSTLLLAMVVATVAGLYPAAKAARLDPVEALRFV